MNTNKIFIFICVVIFTGCNNADKKPVIIITAQEITSEFAEDWRSAHKLYRGKRIEVSGLYINGRYRFINMGAPVIGKSSFSDYIRENITLSCELRVTHAEFYNFKLDEKLVLRGEYKKFDNGKDIKTIDLKNCNVVYREFGKDAQ